MSEHPQFAYTGPSPATGYVGFVNIRREGASVRFTVHSEGESPPYATYDVPFAEAVDLLSAALKGLLGEGRTVPPHGSGP